MEIEIQIDDEKRFTDVALVVDQEEFLEEIKKAREDYKINQAWSEEEYLNFRRSLYINWKNGDDKEKKRLENIVENIRKRLRLPHIFLKVIEVAIFRGVVTEKDYSSALLESDMSSFDIEGNEPDDKYYIVLSPQARDKDVIEAFQEYRDKVNNWINGNISKYHFIWVPNEKIIKGKPSIKDHRRWYLDYHYSKDSIKKISQRCINSCPIKEEHDLGKNKPKGCRCFDESTIRKGIDSYEKLLGKSRTS